MDDYTIERLITALSCSGCGNFFNDECIKILETQGDAVIVKLVCPVCGKKYALAFMDLSFPVYGAALEESFEHDVTFKDGSKDYDGEFEPGKEEKPGKITYDDVLEAHDYIQNFEEHWRRYVAKRKLIT